MTVATRYLLAVYELAGTTDERVSTSALSDAVGRSRPTTTEAIQRLDDHGLVEYEAYQGVRLTDAGRERAASLHEEYEVLNRFFDDVLDIEDADDEAAELVGIVSPTVLARLDEAVIAPVADRADAEDVEDVASSE
ncbi:DtxR family Mn-dependent transcriptional regulator [Halarchaeum rubridurum]|uniref:DtxR family Mn-dependent transcriptional regulator n=1 Tax=Halarchaeum rubridurum TaxID=489911 RepID=A0A830FPE6_9EURY|nr:metal-dependent transcriptional regulator [Halarchaeum rubridurum]MBP1953126.1 DtxR family Mn-dependent transcriptional regulator [Halarchaeum rubridurum]GGM67689.1 iron-dependent repressor [Halarchaeum rubridurum]